MYEPNSFMIWVLVFSSGTFGLLLILFVFLILKTRGGSKQYLATYSNLEEAFEDGPLLELPKGVKPAPKFKKPQKDKHKQKR